MTACAQRVKTPAMTDESPRMQASSLLPLPLILVLAACGSGSDGLRNLDAELAGPDEFSVLPGRQLVMPDSIALPPPTPGGTNLADPNPRGDAVAALGGDPFALQAGGIPAQDTALLAFAARAGSDPAIRTTLAQEDAAFRTRAGGFSFNLFGTDRYFPAYARFALDAYAELARLRASGVNVPTAPPLD
jgi:hypothetical protein